MTWGTKNKCILQPYTTLPELILLLQSDIGQRNFQFGHLPVTSAKSREDGVDVTSKTDPAAVSRLRETRNGAMHGKKCWMEPKEMVDPTGPMPWTFCSLAESVLRASSPCRPSSSSSDSSSSELHTWVGTLASFQSSSSKRGKG